MTPGWTLPELPTGGPLRALVLAASASLLGFAASVALLVVRRRWREAAWCAAPLAAAALDLALGRMNAAAHVAVALVVVLLAARNAWKLTGAARVLQALAGAAWIVALVAAHALFGGP